MDKNDIVKKVDSPHDKIFKKMFGDIEVATDFLKNYLPSEILEITDLKSITYDKETYVSKDLQEYFLDILFKTRLHGEEAYIYFLFEHKSYNDKKVPIQMLEYIINIWNLKIKNNKVPIVIPLLIYHDKDKWKVDKNLINMVEGVEKLPKNILKYIPNYEYILYDIPNYFENEQEKVKGSELLKFILKIFAYAKKEWKEMKFIVSEAEIILNIEFFESFVRYIMTIKDIDVEEFKKVVKDGRRRDLVMSLAEKLENEGRKKEKINTIINLKKLGADNDFISKATELPIKEVEEILKANEENESK
jgi:predicted transposase/invertase (TIGR01784 family)